VKSHAARYNFKDSNQYFFLYNCFILKMVFICKTFEYEIDNLKDFFFETSKFTVLLYFSNQSLIA